MPQRLLPRRGAYNAHPFDGEGTSLYANVGTAVEYRRLRIVRRPRRLARKRCRRSRWIKGTGGAHDIAAGVTKTARIDSVAAPTEQLVTTLPADLLPSSGTGEVVLDVRPYADDVEHLNTNSGTVQNTLDTSGDDQNAILGTALLVGTEVRAGGTVRFRFQWRPAADGVQPDQFVLERTAGPTSPSDVTQSFAGLAGDPATIVEIDVASLSDSAAYTFTVRADDSVTGATADILVGIVVTADASGPTAPTNGAATTR